MGATRVLVLGGGFAGLWSAVGAARKLDELGQGAGAVEVTLVDRNAYHNIRVRNYEADLSRLRVPLDDVLGPAGVRRVEGEVAGIDFAGRAVTLAAPNGPEVLTYDRLVFALGSRLLRPDIPGLAEHAFDVDTYDGAARLNRHIDALPARPEVPGLFTVVVVGAGLTGLETAAEAPGKLRTALARAGRDGSPRVILADRGARVGSDMGESARPIIEEALAALGIETRLGVDVAAVGPSGLTLRSGEEIPAATVVWCAGMRASPLTRLFPVELDRFGRIPVDPFMRVEGVAGAFAAGDAAWSMMDDVHASVMSCQHGRPMGRIAGHNVVCDLLGLPMLPLQIAWYVTVLDLGPWGALYTEGWDRHVVATGEAAKATKRAINGQRIYPPLTRDRREILAAAAPTVQEPPATDARGG
ncbi:NADH dehydrogenase-like protein [Aquisphaera giovannonii]|uniref:NADH dehydrogenase-like protein n=1 Tax=Aquisphaera giovannonii TaxID=406548 RepID=A0A5B9W6M1_9BACT|nr:FAD-dependent oxidoreductase [Aquisphaera giovannonii]QEH35621.1 NADH dehydrogenase-like protein [Aquisphaera giovannonii]